MRVNRQIHRLTLRVNRQMNNFEGTWTVYVPNQESVKLYTVLYVVYYYLFCCQLIYVVVLLITSPI